MAVGDSGTVVRQIRSLFERGVVGVRSDSELLEQFRGRDAAAAEWAFAALVERHGPMVLRVCRNVLGGRSDADDAFQATFLVLARKARAIRGRDSIASWLYGVALRVSSDARKVAARRRIHELRAAEMTTTRVDRGDDDDLAPVIHEEVARLPEKYRLPIILCYFEGQTNEAAARELCWTLGTLQGRLARARELLRSRLVRRGLAPAAGALSALLAPTSAPAAVVPAALAEATVRAAVNVAIGQAVAAGTASAVAGMLAKGALRAMFLSKVKGAMMVAACGVMAAGLFGVAWGQEEASRTSDPQKPPAPRVAVAEEEPRKLNTGGKIGAIVWKDDGRRLAAVDWWVDAGASTGSRVVVWDAANGQPAQPETLKIFQGGTAWAQRVTLSPDFRLAAAIVKPEGAEGARLRFYDLVAVSDRDLGMANDEATALQFSPDGKTLVAGRLDGQVMLWKVADEPKPSQTLDSHGDAVEAMAISQDNTTLAVSAGGVVTIWALSDGKEILSLRIAEMAPGAPHPVALSPDGKRLAIAACRNQNGAFIDDSVLLFDVATGKRLLSPLKGHDNAIVCLAFAPDGRELVSGGWDNAVRLWDVTTGKQLQLLSVPDEVWAVAFSPDGKSLVAGSKADSLQIWPLKIFVAPANP